MKARIISGGKDAFAALVYPPPSQQMVQYVNERLSNVMNTASNYSNQFIDDLKSLYNRYGSAQAINNSKALMYQAGTHLSEDVIMPYSVDNLGDANLIMQRYIMSNPVISELDRKGLCFGFADTYINLEPDTYGEERLDYQTVMDGVYDITKDTIKRYYRTDMSEFRMPELDRQIILDTWDNIAISIMNSIDPTDPDKGVL